MQPRTGAMHPRRIDEVLFYNCCDRGMCMTEDALECKFHEVHFAREKKRTRSSAWCKAS